MRSQPKGGSYPNYSRTALSGALGLEGADDCGYEGGRQE